MVKHDLTPQTLIHVPKGRNQEILMKHTESKSVLSSITAAVFLLLVDANVAIATPRCEAPSAPVDRIACAKAKESPDALRRYIARTQSIHALYFWDYMSEDELNAYHAQMARQKQPSAPVEQEHREIAETP
jgi:hypothetical protein